MLLQTIAGATTTTFNTTFVPQFVLIVSPTGASLTGDITISVNVQGDGVVMNLDAAGFDAMSNINSKIPAAGVDQVGRLFQMADGLVNGKNTFWTIANADAAAINVYGFSKQKTATFWCSYLTQLALASSGTDFTKFAYLAVPTAAALDNFSVLYNDGTQNANATLNELRADNGYYQAPIGIAMNNINPARVSMLTLIPAANRNVYLLKYQPIQGAVDAAAVARG